MMNVRALDDQQLLDSLNGLCRSERDVTARIVECLHEVDKRKLYLEWGYSSLFFFCTKALRYSEGAAMRRIQAARLLNTNPEVLSKLESGALTLSTISEISKAPQVDRAQLITSSEGKSKFEVQRLVAPSLPVKAGSSENVKISALQAPFSGSKIDRRYTVTLELTEEEYQLLQEVQTITSERVRSRAVIRALKLYRAVRSPKERQRRREQRKKAFDAKKVCTSTGKEKSSTAAAAVTRYIPNELRDKVVIESSSRCCYIARDGTRCQETTGLQVDHVYPFAHGGGNDRTNLRILCGAHNRHVYQKFVGAT